MSMIDAIPLLAGAGGDYQISRSVRTRQSASAYFSKTFGVAPTSNQKGTFSFWFKRGLLSYATEQWLFACSATNRMGCYFAAADFLSMEYFGGLYLATTQKFRDPSAWYHFVIAIDSTQATASNRAKMYINGVQVTSFSTEQYPTQNAIFDWVANGQACKIGDIFTSGRYFDGYIAEFNYIDGQQVAVTSFGETDAVTGVWKPKKYTGTYGTNGFYLNFSDNSGVTATTIGKDYSGNGNNWTPSAGISITAGVTYDSFTDVPTPYADGGTGRGNYAVGNPLAVNVTTNATATLTNGNLLLTNGSANYSGFPITMSIPVTGKWAWKFKVTGTVSGSNDGYIGFACNSSGNPVTGASSGAAANWFTTVQVQAVSDRGVVHKYAGGSVVTDAAGSGGTGATGDEWEFLIDRDAGTTIVKLNGTTKATVTGLPATQELFPFATFYQTSGYFIFDYTPSDTSYKTLNTQNLPTPTISNGATVMAATTYTGNGTTQSISNAVNGVSFQPDFVWFKNRTGANNHALYDSVRGRALGLISNATNAEQSASAGNDLVSFDSNGVSLGPVEDFTSVNGSAQSIVAWQWNAGGSTVTNTSGTISSQVRANATAGFSVVTYTGNGTNPGATIGHGLGVTPAMIITKSRSAVGEWPSYHQSLPISNTIYLNATYASGTYLNRFSAVSSTTFTTGSSGSELNTNGTTYVAYCFSAVAGYSAFGKYTGNGSTDGPFVFLGFRPRWLMIKNSSSAGNHWIIIDTARDTYNLSIYKLGANTPAVENDAATVGTSANNMVDILSNGFKLRSTNGDTNGSGTTYIFAAFAENPFKNSLAR